MKLPNLPRAGAPRRLLLPAFLILSSALFACDRVGGHEEEAAAAVDTAAAEAEVKRTEAEMLAAFKAKDPARLAGYYADEAVMATPGRAAAAGRAAIVAMLEADMKDPAFALDFANAKTLVAASGDIAYTRGTFRVTFTDPATKRPREGRGNYVTIFRKQSDGSWKAIEDVASEGGASGGG
jgi:uncharacterized protein (TIGR02246 family)